MPSIEFYLKPWGAQQRFVEAHLDPALIFGHRGTLGPAPCHVDLRVWSWIEA